MDLVSPLTISSLILWSLVSLSSQGSTDKLSYERICGNLEGAFSISHPELVIDTILENNLVTVFMNYSREYVFECKSSIPSDQDNVREPPTEIRFGSKRLNNQWNKYADFVYPGTSLRNLTTDLMDNPRKNQLNKKNETISCSINDEVVCNMNLIVIIEQGVKTCQTPESNTTTNSHPTGVANIRADSSSELECKLNKDIFAHVIRNPELYKTALRYYIHRKKKISKHGKETRKYENSWIECEILAQNNTKFDARFNTYDDLQSIRCPFQRQRKSVYLVRVEKEYKSGITAAIPALAPPNEVQFSYFSVAVDDTVFQFEDEKETTPNVSTIDELDYPIVVPILTSFVTILIVLIILGAVIRWKCFNHTMGTFCFKEDIQNQEDLNVDMDLKYQNNTERYKINFDNERNMRPDEDYMKSNWSGYSNATSTMTDQTYLQRSRVTSENEMLDEVDVDLRPEDKVQFRKKILARQLSGDPSKLNPDIALNEQAKIMVYNPKLEIDRANFTWGKMLGSGNFGCVYEGEASGLLHPSSKTKVAVKTVNDPFDGAQRTALLCEMKILSNLELHLNLVNMMGSCTSDFANSGELWLLLEFCQHGDMKTFLIDNEKTFLKNMSRDTELGSSKEELNSRLLLQWSHNIAKGMKYLSRKHIMHGDLAARNILIGRGQGCNGLSKLVAKVSDFGLSKTFYDNIRYKKQKRQYVPWKWMAIEYLQTGHLTITSDVWSYGIVFWEIFSLGKEPYAGKNSEEMISKLKDGYRLPCPEEVTKESNWSPTEIYNQLADACFVSEPMKRATFSDIVQTLEAALDDNEKDEYKELTEQYASMRELMEDPVTKLKRSSTFTRNSLKQLNEIPQNLSSKTASPHKHGQKLKSQEEENPSYIKAVAVNNPLLPCEDSLSTARLEGDQVKVKDIVADNTIEYIAFQNSEDLNSGQNIHIEDKKDQGVTYIAFEEISTTDKETEEGVKLLPNTINAEDSELKDNETKQNTEEDLSAAYVTISTANR